MAAALAAMMRARKREIATLLASVESDLRAGLSLGDALALTLALSVDAAYVTLQGVGRRVERGRVERGALRAVAR